MREKRISIGILIGFAFVLMMSSASRATEFAVLRQRFDHNPVDVQVPNGGAATTGLTPTEMEIIIPSDDLPADELLTVDFNPVLPAGSPLPGADAFVFGLTLSDPNTGALITQFADPVTVGFSDQALPSGLTYDQLSLAYFDGNTNSPSGAWMVQGSALAKDANGFWCGTTNHFSVFALAETADVPEPTGVIVAIVSLAGLGMRRIRRIESSILG